MGLKTSPTKRQQIIDEITKNISAGKLKPGTRLATVRNMSSYFDVSLSVVQSALRELVDNGFVECRGASGFYVRGAESQSASAKIQEDTEPRIFLSARHHSDLVWRYPYKVYDVIRASQLKNQLALAEQNSKFHFCVEQAEIIRTYLRDNPQELPRFQALLEGNRFEYLGGLNIPDLNMVSGESIVRNMLAGFRYYRETFGKAPEIACATDAFGMCAQLPQILTKCGYRYLLPSSRMANRPPEIPGNGYFRWHGLDGTTIVTANSTAELTHLGYEINVPLMREHESQLARCVTALKHLTGDALVHYMTEEGQIMESLIWIIEAVNRTPGRVVKFGSNIEYFERIAKREMPSFYGEFNPTMTGCYGTRISGKKKIRQGENLLLAAEESGVFSGQERDWSSQWDSLIAAQFHDAACGCCADLAYADVDQRLDSVLADTAPLFQAPASSHFTLCNFTNVKAPQLIRTAVAPAGVPVQQDGEDYYYVQELPACGTANFAANKRKVKPAVSVAPKFRTDYYEADFTTPYPVIRNLQGENVFPKESFGEVLIRSDYGTMWNEQFTSHYYGQKYQREAVESVTEGDVFFKVVTVGEFLPLAPEHGNLGSYWPGFKSLSFRKEYLFPKHLDHFRLKLSLEWQGSNTKISVRFPVALKMFNVMETFEVPFGCLQRKPYFEVKQEFESTLKELASSGDYNSAKGDWPALRWVNYSDSQKGLTVANDGTPGHQLVNGDVLVTLLRSGTAIKDGNMVPQEGSFENGHHEYEFAFCAHSPHQMQKAVALGQMLNCPPRVVHEHLTETGSRLDWADSNVVISAMRTHEHHVLVRLYETLGRETTVNFAGSLLDKGTLSETDMEGANPKPCDASAVLFHPFEIKTFVIK